MSLLEDIQDLLQSIPDSAFDAMPEINNIAGKLYVGDWNAGNNDKILHENDIEYIICISEDNFNTPIAHYQIQIPDNPSGKIEEHFEQTYKMILNYCERGQNILIMSTNGVSRSAVLAVYYLTRRYYETGSNKRANDLINIFKFYADKRPCDIEPAFIKKLINVWEKMPVSN